MPADVRTTVQLTTTELWRLPTWLYVNTQKKQRHGNTSSVIISIINEFCFSTKVGRPGGRYTKSGFTVPEMGQMTHLLYGKGARCLN